jgi:hypothetical protein
MSPWGKEAVSDEATVASEFRPPAISGAMRLGVLVATDGVLDRVGRT